MKGAMMGRQAKLRVMLAALERKEKFDQAVIEACLNALAPEVEVRITFKTAIEAYLAAKQIAGCFDQLGLLDVHRSVQQSKEPTIELTNGSGIVFRIE